MFAASLDIVVLKFARRKNSWESTTMTDEIIEEVWQAKDQLAKRFNYDLDALAAELRKRERESGRKVVNLAKQALPQTVAPAPNP